MLTVQACGPVLESTAAFPRVCNRSMSPLEAGELPEAQTPASLEYTAMGKKDLVSNKVEARTDARGSSLTYRHTPQAGLESLPLPRPAL